jgi:predicted peptidase
MRSVHWLICLGLLVQFGGVSVQAAETGFLSRSVNVHNVEYPYQVYVPSDFSDERTWPVILYLHGEGEFGSDGVSQTNAGLGPAIRKNPERFQGIVIFPQFSSADRGGWQGEGTTVALEALKDTMKEFSGDPNRIYLVGNSLGANGIWYIASRDPDRFAAILAICGFVSNLQTKDGRTYPAVMRGRDTYDAVAKSTAQIPIRIVHGAADDLIPVEESRKLADAFKALNANMTYTELQGIGHGAWDAIYSRADVIEWLFEQKR